MEFPQKYKNKADASTGLLFIKVYNKWHTKIKNELRELGITHPQFVVMTTLAYLSQTDEFVTQSKISKMAEIDVMTVSKIIKVLENNDFINRFQNPNDTRANAVRLLPKGDSIVKRAFPIVVGIDDEFFGVLNEKENTLQSFLKELL